MTHASAPRSSPPIRREELEAVLAELGRGVEDPRAGLFGPGSAFWDVARHSWIFLGAGRAALLQLAHPWVAQAIAEHSGVAQEPWRRFQRTFRQVFAMIFGDLDSALRAARAVHAVHGGLRGRLREEAGAWPAGSAYEANDRSALLWVHATLWDTSLCVYESVSGPLPAAERERYCAESARFAALFGLTAQDLPPDAAAFARYNEQMWSSPALHVGAPARDIAAALLQTRPLGIGALRDLHRLLTAYWLPERIRDAYRLPWSPAHERRARAALFAVRWTRSRWPRRLRELPAYRGALRRLAGTPGPDRLDAWAERLLMGP